MHLGRHWDVASRQLDAWHRRQAASPVTRPRADDDRSWVLGYRCRPGWIARYWDRDHWLGYRAWDTERPLPTRPLATVRWREAHCACHGFVTAAGARVPRASFQRRRATACAVVVVPQPRDGPASRYECHDDRHPSRS